MVKIVLQTVHNILNLIVIEEEVEHVFQVNHNLTKSFQELLQRIILVTLREYLYESDRLVELDLD